MTGGRLGCSTVRVEACCSTTVLLLALHCFFAGLRQIITPPQNLSLKLFNGRHPCDKSPEPVSAISLLSTVPLFLLRHVLSDGRHRFREKCCEQSRLCRSEGRVTRRDHYRRHYQEPAAAPPTTVSAAKEDRMRSLSKEKYAVPLLSRYYYRRISICIPCRPSVAFMNFRAILPLPSSLPPGQSICRLHGTTIPP